MRRTSLQILRDRARVECYLEGDWLVCVITKLARSEAAERSVSAENSTRKY